MFCNLIYDEHIFTLRLRECNKVSRASERTSTFFDFSHDCGLVAREKNEMIVQTLRSCFTDANRKAKRISVLSFVIFFSTVEILLVQYYQPLSKIMYYL